MTADDEMHEHEGHENHDHTQEGEWVSSEPPVDDFADDAQGEAASVSETDEHDHEEQVEAVAEEKKKFPLLLLIGALGSLGVVGGLAYWHFAAHQEDQGTILDTAIRSATEAAAPNFASKPSPKAMAEKPAVVATAPAASPNPVQDVAPKTSYSVPTNSQIDNDKKLDVKTAVAEAAANAAKAANDANATSAWPTTFQAPAQETAPKPAPVVTPQAPAEVRQADDQKLSALSNRIDDLQKSLSQTTQQLSQISDKLSQNQTPAQSSRASNPAVDDRINQLEQKIMQLEQAKTVRAVEPQGMSVENVIPAHSKTKTQHTSFNHSKKKRKTVHAGKPNRWILRAASPEEAWIAKNTDTRELQPVHIGDNVESIGKVTAIQQVGSTWVVQGTHGTIR